jgi:hypothetical protein
MVLTGPGLTDPATADDRAGPNYTTNEPSDLD